jgi:hypothetical protein
MRKAWAALALLPFLCPAQTPEPGPAPESPVESLTIYTDHPRLFLRPSRLKLLRRERDRKSIRWEQFDLLIRGGATMLEPGFAAALYYRVSDDKVQGHKAIEWALKSTGSDPDVRQAALVYDWCQELMTPAELAVLTTRLERALAAKPGNTIENERSRLLAGIALAGHSPKASDAALSDFFNRAWKQRLANLRSGKASIPLDQSFAFYEILHVVRDNLNGDLRDQDSHYFKEFPIGHLLSNYPAAFPAAESEFRIPAKMGTGEPDLRTAALARAAELAMVAFDANAPESQVLQGWLMNDRFLMRGTFGIPYEFLWANPYQPGLSYYHVPLVFHDEIFGRLYVRSNWEDSAQWLGFVDGQLQLFDDGKITMLNPDVTREPLDLDEAVVFFGKSTHRFKTPAKEVVDVFIVGLEPKRTYNVEIDAEEMHEEQTDPGGILYLKGLRGSTGIRFQ